MKTLKIMPLLMMITIMISCSDDESTASLSSEEQAEMVAAALGESGFVSSAEQSAVYANESLEPDTQGKTNACGYSISESLEVTNPAGTLITYAYSYDYAASLVCEDLTPQSLTVSYSYDGEFDAPRLTSDHNGDGALSVTELDGTAGLFAINGSSSRTGGFASKVRNNNSGTSVVMLSVDDVLVNKTSYEIESGSASATVTGEVAGRAFTFIASITFLGEGSATITINGITYVNDLDSGEITVQ